MMKFILIGFLFLGILALAYGKEHQIEVNSCMECQPKCMELAMNEGSFSQSASCSARNNDIDCTCTISGATTMINWSILSLLVIAFGAIQLR